MSITPQIEKVPNHTAPSDSMKEIVRTHNVLMGSVRASAVVVWRLRPSLRNLWGLTPSLRLRPFLRKVWGLLVVQWRKKSKVSAVDLWPFKIQSYLLMVKVCSNLALYVVYGQTIYPFKQPHRPKRLEPHVRLGGRRLDLWKSEWSCLPVSPFVGDLAVGTGDVRKVQEMSVKLRKCQ